MAIDHDGSQIAALMRPYHIRLLEAAAADADQTLGIDGTFDLESVEVQDVLDLLATKVKSVAETTKEQIRRITGEAARDGHGNDWIAKQIQGLKDMTPARADLISVTESASAYSRGSLLRYTQSGQVSGTEWLVSDPCPICAPLAGKVAPLGEMFADDIESPPAHPRCRCAIAPVLKELESAPVLDPGSFETLDDAVQWGKQSYPDITFDFAGAHIDAINPTLAQFHQLAQEYPDVAARLRYIGTAPRDPFASQHVYAHASRDGKQIGLNPYWYGDPASFTKALAQNESIGWLASGKIESLMTHEFGHQVDNWLQMQSATFLPYVRADGTGFINETLDLWRRKNKATSKLSRYATTNTQENFAEAFAARYHMPKAKWPVFVQRFDRLLTAFDKANWQPATLLGHVSDPDERQAAIDLLSAFLRSVGL